MESDEILKVEKFFWNDEEGSDIECSDEETVLNGREPTDDNGSSELSESDHESCFEFLEYVGINTLAARQQLERIPRRPAAAQQLIPPISSSPGLGVNSNNMNNQDHSNNASQFILPRYLECQLSETELERAEEERADRSLFVRQLMLSALSDFDPSSTNAELRENIEILKLNAEDTPSASSKLNDKKKDKSTYDIKPKENSGRKKINRKFDDGR